MPSHKRARILMLAFELPPFNSGGLGEACLGLTKALYKLGYAITFLLPKKLPYNHSHLKLIFADELLNDEEKRRLSLLREEKFISTYDIRKIFQMEELNFEEITELLLKRALLEDFDIIHAHDWMTFRAAVKIKQNSGKKLIVQVHSTEVDRSPLDTLDMEKYNIEKYGMENADIVVTVSNYSKQLIHNFYGIPLEKIHVVYNASNLEELKEVPKLKLKGPIIMFLARITYQKGPNHFLQIAKKVVEKKPEALFVVVGDGDMYKEMVTNACSMGLSGNIIFAGFLRGIQKEIILNSSDLFLMPSISEPFGIVALEAAHFGVPVIISRQSGVSELLQGAVVADFWDIDLMVKEILRLTNNRKESRKLKELLKKDLEKISWDSSALQCEEAYNKLMN